jgi:hypothetical protein
LDAGVNMKKWSLFSTMDKKILLSIFVCFILVVGLILPVSASKVPNTTNVTEKYDRLGDISICSVCSKELLGNVGEQNALSVALGLTVCNDCWWQILYGNDYQTVINSVAQLGEDGKVFPSQLPSMQGGATSWGNITGTISNQTDLQNALSGKLSTVTGSNLDNQFRPC